MNARPYPAFFGYGIEIEHMIVDTQTLDVRPIADQLLRSVGGGYEFEVERGDARWSNELALHVIEMKTAGISRDLEDSASVFRRQVDEMNALLAPMGARLLPGGMHPWMQPERELVLWPHENDVIYRTFDRIFDCRGHGWANLQSVHINLPFQNDEEFARLHAAIRVVLPLVPALAASSPFVEGKRAPALDYRVEVYRHNARRVPSVSGSIIPERVFSEAAYQSDLLQKIYDDLRPLDPDETLLEEWVNARGAIARFERGAIEIRLIDTQECPEQDLALVTLVTAVVQALAEGRFGPPERLQLWDEKRLEAILLPCVEHASRAVVTDREYLDLFELEASDLMAGEVWSRLADRLLPSASPARRRLEVVFSRGTLAERLVRAAGPAPSHEKLVSTYRTLAACLAEGTAFLG